MTPVSDVCELKQQLSKSSIIVMIGPQCSGKTTLASKLTDFSYISLGQAVRECADNELSQLAERLVTLAKPWPAELGLAFVEDDIYRCLLRNQKILLDGYSRRIDEYYVLLEWLRLNNLPAIDTIIEVTASYDTLLARYVLRKSRNNESRSFFDLRYEQYKCFRIAIRSLAVRKIVYDTSEVL